MRVVAGFLALLFDPTLTELRRTSSRGQRWSILLNRLGPFLGLVLVFILFAIKGQDGKSGSAIHWMNR